MPLALRTEIHTSALVTQGSQEMVWFVITSMNVMIGHTTAQTMLFVLTMKGHIHANVKNFLVETVEIVYFKGVKLEPSCQIETLVKNVLSTLTIAFLTAL